MQQSKNNLQGSFDTIGLINSSSNHNRSQSDGLGKPARKKEETLRLRKR